MKYELFFLQTVGVFVQVQAILRISARGVLKQVRRKAVAYGWNGPDWLSMTSNLWPQLQMDDEEENPELQPNESMACVTCCKSGEASLSNVISPSRFSSFEKLLRVTALVLKFIKLLKKKHYNTCSNPLISTEELHEAQHL